MDRTTAELVSGQFAWWRIPAAPDPAGTRNGSGEQIPIDGTNRDDVHPLRQGVGSVLL